MFNFVSLSEKARFYESHSRNVFFENTYINLLFALIYPKWLYHINLHFNMEYGITQTGKRRKKELRFRIPFLRVLLIDFIGNVHFPHLLTNSVPY